MDTLQIQKILVDSLTQMKTIYLVNTNSNHILDYLNLIVPILGLIFTYIKLKKEIQSKKDEMKLKNNLLIIDKINELFGSLIYELESETYPKIYDREPASVQHSIIEAKLLGILDNNITIQKKLADCLVKYKTEQIPSIPEWVIELKTLKDRVCKELENNE